MISFSSLLEDYTILFSRVYYGSLRVQGSKYRDVKKQTGKDEFRNGHTIGFNRSFRSPYVGQKDRCVPE